jgi:hypothetical protein
MQHYQSYYLSFPKKKTGIKKFSDSTYTSVEYTRVEYAPIVHALVINLSQKWQRTQIQVGKKILAGNEVR